MKSACQHIQTLLDRFIRDDLSPYELRSLQTHLDNCAGCQQELESEPWEHLLSGLPKRKCPGHVIQQVEKTLLKEQQLSRKFRMIRWHWRQTVLAGLAAAATVAILVLRPAEQANMTQISRPYSEEDIAQAQEVMKWSMAFTAQKMKQSETRAIDDVFTNHLPETIQKSIRKVLPILQGD